MAELENGRLPTREAERLVRRDWSPQIVSLGEQRTITRELMEMQIGQFNPEIITLGRMHLMRRDTMIQLGLNYRRAPMFGAEFHMEGPSPLHNAAADKAIRNIWANIVRTGTMPLEYGYQGCLKQFDQGKLEAEYEDQDGDVHPVWDDDVINPMVIKPLINLPPDWTRVKLNKNTGKYEGLTSSLGVPLAKSDNERNKHVPAEFTMWFHREFEGTFHNWYGYPLLGHAYPFWYSYWFRHFMEDMHFEQDADPALQVWFPSDNPQDVARKKEGGLSNREIALNVGADLRGGATVAWPSDVHVDEQGKKTAVPLWRAEFLEGGENLEAFLASREALDILKLRAMLVPEQALIEGVQGTGSRATSSVHADMYEKSLRQDAEDLADSVNKYMLPQFLEGNWGPDHPPVTMVIDAFQDNDLDFAKELVTAAFTLDPNALPIKFEDWLKQLKVPTYTPKEQEEREAEVEAAQQEQQAQAAQQAQQAAGPGTPAPVPGGPPPGAQGVGLAGRYVPVREIIHLDTRTKAKAGIPATPPDWALSEFARRHANTVALAERLEDFGQEAYELMFASVADAIVTYEDSIELAVSDVLDRLMGTVRLGVQSVLDRIRRRGRGELASMYHAGGVAELQRLGLDATSWDIGREEVQGWATERAGDLVKTMSKTVVEQHLRPFLSQELQRISEQGVSGEPIELAQRITEKFQGYPDWMAKRLARTEARMGYNNSAADMWEEVGVELCQEYDGQGGESGVTDLECLRRNGQIVTLDEFREDDRREHPNGTLGAIPFVEEDVALQAPAPALMASQVSQSDSAYAVTEDGWILSQTDTGKLLAEVG